MSFVLIRLRAPMQSWGTQSAHRDRSTERFPTKSGVIGLVANALGRDLGDSIDDLSSLVMGAGEVIMDKSESGHIAYDYQTAGGGYDWWKHLIKDDDIISAQGKIQKGVILRRKGYLGDADFLVALSGVRPVVNMVANALKNPSRPLFLGRKCFLPSLPVFDSMYEGDEDVLATMRSWEHLGDSRFRVSRVLMEVPFSESERSQYDQPINFGDRTYSTRGSVLHYIDRSAA